MGGTYDLVVDDIKNVGIYAISRATFPNSPLTSNQKIIFEYKGFIIYEEPIKRNYLSNNPKKSISPSKTVVSKGAGTKTIDSLLTHAKSFLKDLLSFHANGGYSCKISLSTLNKIKGKNDTKSQVKIDEQAAPRSSDYIHYPMSMRPTTGSIYEKTKQWQKCDIYSLGVCFLEMLYKMDFCKKIPTVKYDGRDVTMDYYLLQMTNKPGGISVLVDPKNNIISLYNIYDKNEQTKIKDFLNIVKDMLNNKLNASTVLYTFEKLSEENRAVQKLQT